MKAGWIGALSGVLMLAAACEGQIGDPGVPTATPGAIGAGDSETPPSLPPVIPGGFEPTSDPTSGTAMPSDPSLPADPTKITPPDSTIPPSDTTPPPPTDVMP